MAKSLSGFKNSQGRCPFLHTLPPHQTTGSPFKLLQQRLISGTSHCVPSPPPLPLTSHPMPKQQGQRGKTSASLPNSLGDYQCLLSRLELAFLSLQPPSLNYLQKPTGIKRDNIKIVAQQLSGGEEGRGTTDLPIFFLPSFSKRKNARIVHLFQTDPQQFQTAHSGTP